MVRKSTPATKTGHVSAAALGILLCAIAHPTTAAGGDSPDALFRGAAPHGYFCGARSGASLSTRWTNNFDEICRCPEESTHICLDGEAVQPASPTAYAGGQDLLTRLHYVFGSDVGLSSDRARQEQSEVLLKNSNAFVRAKIPVTLGREWRGFVYVDVGAADSALRWQGLVGIRGGHGVDVLGGWRHVTYHFNAGSGFDSLDFDGPFLGATLTW